MRHLIAIGALAWTFCGAASAQAPQAHGFSAVYNVHAKGIVAGKFSYAVIRTGDAYKAHAERWMTGLVRAFVGSKQDYKYAANGLVTPKGLAPLAYQHSGGKKGRVVRVAFTPDDAVTVATPPMGMGDPPATKAQKAGALDQLSSIYAMAITDGDPCARTLKVYLDGRSRFDLVMRPDGAEKVSTAAYKGLARRCIVDFRPIAGFSDPQKPATLTFLFGDVHGLKAPLRIAMPTDDAGIVTLEATSFTPS